MVYNLASQNGRFVVYTYLTSMGAFRGPDQPPGRKYYLGATIIRFSDRFWSDGTSVFGPTWNISMRDDTAMSAIQTALAVFMEGSSFATKLPFITPIAGLILQALTMRDARVPQISYDNSVF